MAGKDVSALASQLDPPLTIVDVGARGGIEDCWAPLVPYIRAYGFDVDADECAELERRAGSAHVRFVPLALGASPGPATLHLTADPACASLYPPDETAADLHPALDVIRPIGTQDLTLDTLDAWSEREGVSDVSYLKLDAQGAELDILRGARRLLATACALRVEVEFNPIYRGQPLFGDVDAFLREQGFVLWRLTDLCHYLPAGQGTADHVYLDHRVYAASATDVVTAEVEGVGGRLFWADALFVRRELADGTRPAERDAAARAACVLWAIGVHELAAICR